MPRITPLLLLLAPGLAAAENRLDLEPIPELGTLEPVHHLDRGYAARSGAGAAGHIGLGYGKYGDDKKGLVGEGSLRIGMRMKQLTVAGTSDLVAGASELVRGKHTGYLELRTDDDSADEDDIGGSIVIKSSVEHGEARGLAPVHIGPGKRNHGEASADLVIGLEPDKDDLIWGALVTADGSVTRWLETPLLDHAYRGAFGLGVSLVPRDGEIPRGRIDLLRARVEHANIKGIGVTGAGGAIEPLRDTQVRTIEVMSGVHEFTGHIDHEMLVVATAELGAAWIEADAAGGPITETMFEMNVGAHLKWRRSRIGRREFGFALARQPGTTADGQHLVTDWRLEMIGATEDKHFVLGARGGISWIKHLEGGVGGQDQLKRYGSHVEGFVKLGAGLELGGYHAMTFEPRRAGDPWASPREFVTEFGVLARWRPSTY